MAVAEESSEWVARPPDVSAIVAATLRARTIQMTAEALLSDARAEADQIRHEAESILSEAVSAMLEANTEAATVYRETVADAKAQAREIITAAQDQREMLVSAALSRIAELSGALIEMADRIVAHADDPTVARAHLAHFVLELADVAEQLQDGA